MTYKAVLTGENWKAVFEIEAQDAETAIKAVRNVSLYDHEKVKFECVNVAAYKEA